MPDRPRLTNRAEVLRRQIVGSWTSDGEPMSVAFRPTPKDERLLSTDQERISLADSYQGYETRTKVRPHSTWGISVGCVLDANDCLPEPVRDAGKLEIIDDGGTDGLHEGHASIAFSDYDGASSTATRKHDERIARELKKEALSRGRLYPPTS